MDFAQLILISILVEAIWENLKILWAEKKFNFNMLGSLILAIAICTMSGMDIFKIVGIELALPLVGSVLTGVVVSRGANFVNDLFSKLQGGK